MVPNMRCGCAPAACVLLCFDWLTRRAPRRDSFSPADLYDIFLEVRRKNAELTPLPQYAAALEKMYADGEQRQGEGMSPDARAAAAARLALLAAARGDTLAAAAT